MTFCTGRCGVVGGMAVAACCIVVVGAASITTIGVTVAGVPVASRVALCAGGT